MTNYFWARDHAEHEVEWVHAQDIPSRCFARPVVLVNGCFDLLHVGHLRLLAAARRKAGKRGTLVVSMDSDKLVRSAKAGRPILTWTERASAMAYGPRVDVLVEIQSHQEFEKFVAELRPNLLVTGSDKLGEERFPWLRKMVVPKRGMSTSTIVTRCQKATQ